ncbi:uncharacterized protein LOC132949181 [Metopolophium dirhodum]|uniref:uncharacterized protein LOC132949181 n=1 Tax=Metopolophium dirhodum TaxID=44670 RepID=UPI00298F9C33|nr:uncharacterized protein LOC132949181 [Metopolophium dirhodum]
MIKLQIYCVEIYEILMNLKRTNIIPFKGRSTIKQYNKAKPHKWGIKEFALASKNGFVHDFELYVGKGTIKSKSTLGLSVYIISIDVQFETIWNIGKWNFGCKWFDNKFVHLFSNYIGPEPTDEVQRWSTTSKTRIPVQRPAVVKEYNSFMGGVDLHDMLVEIYRIDIRRKNKVKKRGKPSSSNSTTPPQKKYKTSTRPANDIRFDCYEHWPENINNKQRCKHCIKAYSRTWCSKCKLVLCYTGPRNCFKDYHQK